MSTNFQFENWTKLVGYWWKEMGITNFQFENWIELIGYLWEGRGIIGQHWLLVTTQSFIYG